MKVRFNEEFDWLYREDPKQFEKLKDLIGESYSTEDGIFAAVGSFWESLIQYDFLANDSEKNPRGGSKKFSRDGVRDFIRAYIDKSRTEVRTLHDNASEAELRILTVAEYDRMLSDDPFNPQIMVLGEIVTKLSAQSHQHSQQMLNTVLAYSSGALFLVALLWLMVKVVPNPTRPQLHVFGIILALAAGGFATVLSGMLNVQMKVGKRFIIGATGALAVFVIVFFFTPALAK